MNLPHKVALVTGASEGIGREIVISLVKRGVRCIAVSRHASEHPFESDLVSTRNCDIMDLTQIKQLFDWVRDEFGQLDIVVNNAGIWHKVSPLEEIEDETIETVVRTNLLGPVYCSKYALPLLKTADEAAIVNIVSSAGLHAKAGRSVYAASKFGLRGATEALCEDLKDSPIHVMGVYQSGTNTRLFAKAGDTMPLETYIEPADLAEHIVNCLALPPKIWVSEVQLNRS